MTLGCSSFTWDTEDGKHLLGRTYDQFGDLSGNCIAVIPRNYRMRTELREGSGPAVTVKYAHLGMAIMGLHTPVLVDGINEKGLAGALLNYPEYAVYDTQRDYRHINIHPGLLIGYLLGQCASVKEAVNHIAFLNLTNEKIFGNEIPVHYIFSDATGEAIIIEPDETGIRIHRDSLGVMTNSPDYLWHKTNLRNYLPVTNLNTPSRDILGVEFTCFSKGTGGGFGLPGDYSSPARFVRTAIMKNFAVKGKDEIDGVTKMIHNFAPVNIPRGILKGSPDEDDYEQTLCISIMCSESLTYYFNTARNCRISALCLGRELKNHNLKCYELPEKQDVLFLNVP